MSARMVLHWTATTIAAAIASLAAALPFTGPAASYVGLVACGAVCLIGIATTPNTRRGDSK